MPKNSKYQDFSKEELINEIQKLKKMNKYGIVWEEKIEKLAEECKEKLPFLKEVKSKKIQLDKNNPFNFIIEGDNYHSLSVLNYTHNKSIDVIYIDPPYNIGHGEFTYNAKLVDIHDSYRHSKWLSFMKKRLKLAKNLLKDTGVIFISIDDNEAAQLKLLCDEIFDEKNLVGWVTVAKGTTTGQDAKRFGSSTDFLLIYGRPKFIVGKFELSEKDRKRFHRKDKKGNYSILQWRKTGSGDKKQDRPNLFYPIKDPEGHDVYPIGPTGYDSRWRGDINNFNKLQKKNMVEWVKREDGWKPYIKYYLKGRGKAPSTLWNDIAGNKKATIELKDIFRENVFSNPKPTDLIKKCLNLSSYSSPIVLDFFAGSGTTGHAVMQLNEEDNGQRRFILCTNNENNICTNVCYPRIQKLMEGYINSKGEKVDGLGGNLKYFRADFVDAEPTDKNKRKLTDKATEMLCVKEDTFEQVVNENKIKIFKNNDHYTGIIFDQLSIPDFKKRISKIDSLFSVYIFSLGGDTFEEEFSDIKDKVKLTPIPESILKVYKKIFK